MRYLQYVSNVIRYVASRCSTHRLHAVTTEYIVMNVDKHTMNDTRCIMRKQHIPQCFLDDNGASCNISGMRNEWYKRARKLMSRMNMTQEDMSKTLDVTRPAIGHWLSGRREPGLDNLVRIAKLLKCSTDLLLCGKVSEFDIDDVDREFLRLLNDLTSNQIERLMDEMRSISKNNSEIRNAPTRNYTVTPGMDDGSLMISTTSMTHKEPLVEISKRPSKKGTDHG